MKNIKEQIRIFVKKRPYLVWYVSPGAELSEESTVEHVLNYGTWNDVQALFRILGKKKVSQNFFLQIEKKRNNYRPEIKNYFSLYFSRYVPR